MGAGNFSISPVITYSNSDATLTSNYWADYEYVWGDEFNDGRINSLLWQYGAESPSSIEKPYNVKYNRNLVKVNDSGEVVFTLDYDETANAFYRPPDLHTKSTMNYKYGYIEMRAKLPLVQNSWTSFWTQSVVDNYNTLVASDYKAYKAETDIFETLTSDDTALVPNLHKWFLTWENDKVVSSYDTQTIESVRNANTTRITDDEYHIIGMEWTDEYIKMFIDGVPYAYYSFNDLEKAAVDPFGNITNSGYTRDTQGFREPILICVGTGIKKLSNPSPNSFPNEFCVDWIRLYQKNPVENSTIWTR